MELFKTEQFVDHVVDTVRQRYKTIQRTHTHLTYHEMVDLIFDEIIKAFPENWRRHRQTRVTELIRAVNYSVIIIALLVMLMS